MSRIIAHEWPTEYAGPREILGPGFIPWAGRPRLVENDNGQWLWLCTHQLPQRRRTSRHSTTTRTRMGGTHWILRKLATHPHQRKGNHMIASALLCDLCPNVFIADKPGTNSFLTRSAIAGGWTSTKDHNADGATRATNAQTTQGGAQHDRKPPTPKNSRRYSQRHNLKTMTPEAIVAALRKRRPRPPHRPEQTTHHGPTKQEKP